MIHKEKPNRSILFFKVKLCPVATVPSSNHLSASIDEILLFALRTAMDQEIFRSKKIEGNRGSIPQSALFESPHELIIPHSFGEFSCRKQRVHKGRILNGNNPRS